jgi:SAM-dependent methyltransferase
MSQLKSESSGFALLDLGCGFGQNIRQLVLDGAAQSSLVGADLSQGLIDCGFDYFQDRDRLTSEFIVGDVLDEESAIARQAAARFDVVWAACFFHLWDWDKQLEASVAASKLLKPVSGSTVIGWQIGAEPARNFVRESTGQNPRYAMYQHDAASLSRLWDEVGLQTGTKWNVEAKNRIPDAVREVLGASFGGDGVGLITFTITRL